VILPVLYAVLVWFLSARFRRRWQGAATVILAVALLTALGSLAVEGDDLHGQSAMPEWWQRGSKQFLVLLVPYGLLVGTVACFLVTLPRRKPDRACRGCGYDLDGLEPRDLLCPECGAEWAGAGSGKSVPEPLIPIPEGRPWRQPAPGDSDRGVTFSRGSRARPPR
jgi:hypothetical protein